MKSTRAITNEDVLKLVLKDYEPISKATVECADATKKYKCIDVAGNIYLTTNPHLRSWREDEKGYTWIAHPEPQLVLAATDARRDATTGKFGSRQDADQEVAW